MYHGTDNLSAINILNNGIALSKCNSSTDNYKGFYTTQSFDFAQKRAKQIVIKKQINNKQIKPVVIKFEFSENKLDSSFCIKKFTSVCDEWKYFVVINRIGKNVFNKYKSIFESFDHNLDTKYDLVYDPTADAGIADIVGEIKYSIKKINWVNLTKKIQRVNIGNDTFWDNQISFHTNKSLNLLKAVEIIEL